MCHKSVKVISLIVFFLITSSSLAALKVGDRAPNFNLRDQNNLTHDLNDYKGNWVVLYFYPKDGTPGCTTQACDFRDAVKRIIASKSVVFGVSLDSVESHKLFSDKNKLPFSLLSDETGEVAKSDTPARTRRGFGEDSPRIRRGFSEDLRATLLGGILKKVHEAALIWHLNLIYIQIDNMYNFFPFSISILFFAFFVIKISLVKARTIGLGRTAPSLFK